MKFQRKRGDPDDAVDQVQLAQIVNSTVSQALTQAVQQTASNPSLAAAASTAAVQQIQSSTMFEIPTFEGDNSVVDT